jgi:hypothetical protein
MLSASVCGARDLQSCPRRGVEEDHRKLKKVTLRCLEKVIWLFTFAAAELQRPAENVGKFNLDAGTQIGG